MNSILHLKSYAFSQFSVKTVPGGSLEVEPKMDVSIAYTPVTGNSRRVQLGIRIGSSEKEVYGYEVDILMEALILVNSEYKIKDIERAACVNAASILFSAAREAVLTLTGRCIPGALFLPTINFLKVIEQPKAGKSLDPVKN